MDMIQLTIIAVVVGLILITISYYLYQEAKFKKMVENNFNQATEDVITNENKAFTLDGIDLQKDIKKPIMQKDVVDFSEVKADPLFDMEAAANTNQDTKHVLQDNHEVSINEPLVYPEHSVEAFFADIHKIHFPFANDINPELDFIVDIGFEDVKKIKVLPEITQFTNKTFKFYVLDKHGLWSVFNKGEKYVARALKLVVPLVDHEGIISQAQLLNIYNEAHKFVMQNEGHIYKSDYESAIMQIQSQIKHLEKIELNLSLYIITQTAYSYLDLAKFFSGIGLDEYEGTLRLTEHGKTIFKITAENSTRFESGKTYNLLQITSNLHNQTDPNHSIEKIFDCAEKIMQNIESRLLTSSKKVLEQRDYDAILQHVKRYTDSARSNGVKLGGELINRLL